MTTAAATAAPSADVDDPLRVGRFAVPVATAARWIAEYTNATANRVAERPFACPAYDDYDASGNVPHRLTDADLLAPVLLNVRIGLRTFYGLQRLREVLQPALADPLLARPLTELAEHQVADRLAALYACLDAAERPWGVDGTTLTKVLHRKRPASLVLHDQRVRAAYVGDGAPVPRARRRSWVAYLTELTLAVRADLASQSEQWARLVAAADRPLTLVRLLDIVAWRAAGDLGIRPSRDVGAHPTDREA